MFSFLRRHLFWQVILACLLTVFVVIAPLVFSDFFALPFSGAGRTFVYDFADIATYFDHFISIFGDSVSYTTNIPIVYPPLANLFLFLLRSISYFFGQGFSFFAILFKVSMGVFFCLSLYVGSRLLRAIGRAEAYLWLLFLPSSLFFIFSRFDIVLVFFIFLTLFLLYKQKFSWSLFVLALSVMFKWFTAFIAPFYFIYMLFLTHGTNDKQFTRRIIQSWVIFIAVIILINILSVLVVNFDFVFHPYAFQFGRPIEIGSFLAVLFGGPIFSQFNIFPGIFHISPFGEFIFKNFFTFLQFFPFIALCFLIYRFFILKKSDTRLFSFQVLLFCACLMIMSYVFFNRVYSPQWILWILPLLLLVVTKKVDILLVIVLDVLNYLHFPLGWEYLVHGNIFLFQSVVFMRSIIFIILIFRLYFFVSRLFLGKLVKLK